MSETETNQSNQTTEAAAKASDSVNSPESLSTAPAGAVVFHLDQILQKRLLATFIDMVLVGVIAAVLIFIATMVLGQFFGSLFSFFVLAASAVIVLIKDMPFKFGELDSQSPGKKAMNIKVTNLQGNPITLKQSMQRNAILAMPYVLSALGSLIGAIPMGIGLVGTLLIVMPLMFIAGIANVYEIYRIYSSERNRRWGDEFAGTIVAWE